MFHLKREIKIAEVHNGAKDFHFCRRHRMNFNPTGFCPSCGDLRPPRQINIPNQLQPGQIGMPSPWQPINTPYTGPIYGGVTTSDRTVWDPSNPTFTMTTGTYVPPNTNYTYTVSGGGGGGGGNGAITISSNAGVSASIPAGTLFYSSDEGALYTSDGTTHIKIGEASVVANVTRL